jgi:hypothetical protein
MKMDFAEEHYEQMRRELRDLCRSQTAWWSPVNHDLPAIRFEYNPVKALSTARQFIPDGKLCDVVHENFFLLRFAMTMVEVRFCLVVQSARASDAGFLKARREI